MVIMKTNNKIPRARMLRRVLCVGLALFFLSAAIPAHFGHAQRRVKGEWVLPPFYPDGFHGWGRINRITADRVVIDDAVLKLAPSVVYRTPANRHATGAYFEPGSLVGFMTNENKEIVSLWLIRE
jgi:hypothetical protein